MRILFRHLDPGKGGAVSSLVKLLEAYACRFPEDHLSIMCTRNSPLANVGRLPNCEVVFVGQKIPRAFHLLGFADIVVRRLFRERKLDLFWPVNIGLYFSGGPPQVMTMNNPHQVYPPSPDVPHPRSRFHVLLMRWFFRRSLRVSSAVIVQTDLMRQLTQVISGCPELVAVVPKAVTEPGVKNAPLSQRIASLLAPAASAVRLLYVATAIPHKNHKLLASVMQRFRLQGRSIKLVLTIHRAQWLQCAGELGASLVASGHVILLDWVDKDELQALYEACDFSVMPSVAESLSSAHVEAMYWKRPQVVADLPYAHDLCRDAALYADPKKAESWCEQLEKLLADPELQHVLIARGTARIKDFPSSWTEMAEAVRPVFLSVLERRAAAAHSARR